MREHVTATDRMPQAWINLKLTISSQKTELLYHLSAGVEFCCFAYTMPNAVATCKVQDFVVIY